MPKPISSPYETASQLKNPISFSGLTVNQVKLELTDQLNEKEKVLKKTGTNPLSRNALIQQTEVIKKELLDLNQYDQEQELPLEIRSKLENLANKFQYLKSTANSHTSSSKLKTSNPSVDMSPSLPPPPTNSSPTKQRTKLMNGNRRNPDIEFATEIGQGLLIEVRKLQNILQEKDEIIKQLQLSQADNERTYETIQKQLKQKEENDEKLKEENWDLEVKNQELQTHLSEANQAITKHNVELGRLTKQLKSQSEQMDIMKAQEEKSTSMMEVMKARHEQETHQLRRHAATAQREQAQLQKEVDALNTEVKICKAKLAIKLATAHRADESDALLNVRNDDPDLLDPMSGSAHSGSNTAAVAAATQASRSQAMETETLKQSLAHAHRIISNLRSSYHKEKLEKFELKKMLSESQEHIEQMRKEVASQPSLLGVNAGRSSSKSNHSKRKPISPKKKRVGVARQARGLSHHGSSDTDQQTLEDSYTEEDNTSSDDDNLLDPEFSNQSFGFGESISFSSTPMKPLSSELEANKVQVIDVGINTDPMDWNDMYEGVRVNETHSIPKIINGKTPTVNGNLPDNSICLSSYITAQEGNMDTSPVDKESSLQPANIHFAQGSDVSHPQTHSQDTSNQPHQDQTIVVSSMPATIEEYTKNVQEHISSALIKERKTIANRAAAILSPEQINMLFLPLSYQAVETDSSQQANPIDNASRHSPILAPNKGADNYVVAFELEQEGGNRLNIDELVQKALLEKTADMVPKSQVDALIATAEQQARANMVPKEQVDTLISAAIETIRADIHAAHEQSLRRMATETAESISIPPNQAAHETFDKGTSVEDELSKIQVVNDAPNQNNMLEQLLLEEKKKMDILLEEALEKQKIDLELSKQQELEQLEASRIDGLEKQRQEMEEIKRSELNKFTAEMEILKTSALKNERKQLEASKHAELEKQRSEMKAIFMLELEKQKTELEMAKSVEYEKQRAQVEQAKKLEIEELSKVIDSFKKESEDTNQRMKSMLTKESADVLIKRAVAEVMEQAERNQAEALAGMISREYANRMVKDEVSKALEIERKEVAEREAAETIKMISKAEADALAKVAAADAIVKERQTNASREKDLITKNEADLMVQEAVRKAAEKERAEASSILDKERKTFSEKEARMILKEDADKSIKEAVQAALLEYQQKDRAMHAPDVNFSLQNKLEPAATEQSISTSNADPPSTNPSPSHSISSPANINHHLRLSRSKSSLKLGLEKKEKQTIPRSNNPRQSTESVNHTISSFGTFRILGTSKYSSPHRLHSRSTMSLRELASKQNSSTSISTMSSSEDHHSNGQFGRIRASETFPVFPNTEDGTDIEIISAITQTMIGEWMLKNTRRYVGGGISENKHQRFFWVHPYTKILYWSSTQPGAEGVQGKTKNAYIESVSSVSSHNNSGASTLSLLVKTPKRSIKITAPSLERHELWLKSLIYLLSRPNNANQQIIEESRQSTDSTTTENADYLQTAILNTHNSERSIPQIVDATQYDSDESEDIVNLRQCCNGKHDVSTLSREARHH
ncbi:MAG: hypothetical protein EXX96DRAFT_516368 [Benjaminiella poitrasii]|nr:MAG: hypothetical protein EXX96DRAFT_516368 [Benjaminiella poitrasii]